MNYEDLLTEENNKRKSVSKKSEKGSNSPEKDLEHNEKIALRQRLSDLELSLAQKNSVHNNDVSKLHEQISKLRSSFEKNELLRQKLDYELTLVRKESSQEKRKSETEKLKLQNDIDNLQDEVLKYSTELATVERLTTEQKEKLERMHRDWSDQLTINEAARVELKRENEILYEERLSTESQLLTWKNKYDELEEKYSLLEGQQRSHVDTIRKLTKDSEYSNKKEEELIEELKGMQEKVKLLESNVEAERAAHLETKFHMEVTQLKVRDTENLFGVETARYNECKANLDNVNKKCRDTENVMMKEREIFTQLNAAHNQMKKEISDMKNANKNEITEKTDLISTLSADILNYKQDVDKLQKQQEQMRTKLINLESSKGDVIKELRFLLNNYQVISEVAKSPDKNDAWNFSGLIEQIRQILEDYQNKLADKEKQIVLAHASLEKVKHECETHREIEWNRDRALQEAEKLVKDAQNELLKCQKKCAGLEERLRKLEDDEKHMKGLLEKRNDRITQLNEEIIAVKLDREQIDQSAFSTLQVAYELLMTGSIQPSPSPIKFSMNELKDIIINRLREDLYNWKMTSQKLLEVRKELEHTKRELVKSKEGIKKLQSLNSDVLSKTEKSLVDSQQLWFRERKAMEEAHRKDVAQLNADLQQLEEKYKQNALNETETMYRRIQETGAQNHGMRKIIHKIELENKSLKINTNIITGALWALLLRCQSLRVEKQIVWRMLTSLTTFKTDICELSVTLSQGMKHSAVHSKRYSQQKSSGIFRFRVFVVLVLASKRFARICLFTKMVRRKKVEKEESFSLYYCNTKEDEKVVRVSKEDKQNSKLFQWLHGSPFCKIARQKIPKSLMREKHMQNEFTDHSVWTYYTTYVDVMKEMFANSSAFTLDSNTSTNLLVQRLGNGLKRILLQRKHQSIYISSAEVISAMRESVLKFTERLHESELDRRSLKVNYDCSQEERDKFQIELNKEREYVKSMQVEMKRMRLKLHDCERQLKSMFSEEKFDQVCTDLNNALKREEELQEFLENQKVEIEKMDDRIDKYENLNEKTDQKLSEREIEVKQQEEHIRNLQENFLNLQKEKESMQKLVENKQSEITRHDREREVLSSYLRNVSAALYESKQQIAFSESHRSKLDCVLPLLITPNELLAVDGITLTPGLTICQNTVQIFLDAQRDALQQISNLRTEKQVMQYKIAALHEDVSTHKNRIQKLKNQIAAACQEDVATLNMIRSSGSILVEKTDNFMPLT